jgi:hypothetical protein
MWHPQGIIRRHAPHPSGVNAFGVAVSPRHAWLGSTPGVLILKRDTNEKTR